MPAEKLKILSFLLDFGYTMLVVFIIAGLFYYRKNGKKGFFFSCVMVAAVVFQLCLMLVRIPIELGFAIGLFAIFGIIRYRTTPINPRELTYMLVCAGIAAKNALALDFVDYYKIATSDALLVLLILILDWPFIRKSYKVKIIVYNKLDLIHEDLRPRLINDLEISFGIKNIQKIQVGKIDTVKKSAQLKVYFQDKGDQNFSSEDQF